MGNTVFCQIHGMRFEVAAAAEASENKVLPNKRDAPRATFAQQLWVAQVKSWLWVKVVRLWKNQTTFADIINTRFGLSVLEKCATI
jgi:hypothetical protein